MLRSPIVILATDGQHLFPHPYSPLQPLEIVAAWPQHYPWASGPHNAHPTVLSFSIPGTTMYWLGHCSPGHNIH